MSNTTHFDFRNKISFHKGFDVQEVKAKNRPQKGLGLIAMEERARILGGPFERTSGKGKGTRITLSYPL